MLLEQEIERVIFGGEYAPGDRINEKELALRFGISRGPVREALRALEASGLVELTPNRGVSVRRLSAAEAADIYEVRAALFALAGGLLAKRVTDEQIASLRRFVSAMDTAIDAGNYERYLTENFALHDYIVEHAGNTTLPGQYRALVKQLRLYRARSLTLPASVRASNDEHHDMVDAIAARDPERAWAAHHHHVATAKERLLANPNLT
jgi:DNA-binding GntR family transcriptional regulator